MRFCGVSTLDTPRRGLNTDVAWVIRWRDKFDIDEAWTRFNEVQLTWHVRLYWSPIEYCHELFLLWSYTVYARLFSEPEWLLVIFSPFPLSFSNVALVSSFSIEVIVVVLETWVAPQSWDIWQIRMGWWVQTTIIYGRKGELLIGIWIALDIAQYLVLETC
jgi:hypothetical protein